ncbi:MAG: S-layer homology domain-containing protein [Oscillospiraceae bacterium]|nr:S-layer homology domain-containing protein [Oscillospiraceae bacterium]
MKKAMTGFFAVLILLTMIVCTNITFTAHAHSAEAATRLSLVKPSEFEPSAPLEFLDVHDDDWFYRPVAWAFENGIMNGLSTTQFAPHDDMTRAMLVTILWRYAGQPDAGLSPFEDVADGRWYSTAIAWAHENGIVLGLNPTTFGGNNPVNREQMYTILFRYMSFAELTIDLEEDGGSLLQFADEDEISAWALEAMYFMYDAQIMFRYSTMDIYARPAAHAFRAEIAAAMFFFDMYATPISIIIPPTRDN